MRSPPASESEAVGSRFLIATGTAQYALLPQEAQLPSVHDDLQRIVDLFTGELGLGYKRLLADLAESPTSDELRRALSDWFSDEARRPEDIVVLYYSGHGGPGPDGRHYLLGREFNDRNYIGTALATEDLARMLAGGVVQQLLLILDTCYAGKGVGDLTAPQRIFEEVRPADNGAAGFYFLAASRSKEEADQGIFARVLVETVRDPRLGGAAQAYLDPSAVVAAINEEFARREIQQHARLNVVGFERLPPFLPNPRYRPGLPSGTLDLQTERRLLREPDLVAHWGPRARGVEIEAAPGWLFRGRTRALAELVAFVDRRGGCKARVVTGGPGSGKSAVLARLVTLADPDYRRRVPLEGVPAETIPPEGAIHAAIHARGKDLGALVAELAAAAGLSETDPDLLVNALAGRSEPLVVVLDALDEALEPEALARRFLRSLALTPAVRLIVGTRPPLLPALGPAFEAPIDLDAPDYFDLTDIAEYVERILVGADDPASETPYRGHPNLAANVAAAVAARARPTFLIAGLVARTLAERTEPVDVEVHGWKERFPAAVGDALDEYLERFGPDEERARSLVRPLAYAEGAGLPWENLWAPLAASLAGRSYDDEDVDWLQREAGAYIVRALDEGRTVYRLFHQALAAHLRPEEREAEDQRRIVASLIETVPDRPEGKDWARSHSYVRTHLAGHAAAAGLLDELLCDPLYLLAAEPVHLLRVLPHARGEPARQAAFIYQGAVHRLSERPPGEAASYLELAARQAGIGWLADAAGRLDFGQRWWAVWAQWAAAGVLRIIGRHEDFVLAVAVSKLDGLPIAVSGGRDGTLRLWDIASWTQLGEPLPAHDGGVTALAVGELDGRPVAVSGGEDGALRFWDLAAHAPVGEPLPANAGAVWALAYGDLDGRPIAVSGQEDGALRFWDLAACAPLGEPLPAHADGVTALAVCEVDRRQIVVSGGSGDGALRLWDLAARAPLGEPLPAHADGVTALAVGELDGRPVAVSGSEDGALRVWDLAARAPLGESLPASDIQAVRAVAVCELDSRPVVVSACSNEWTVRLWDVAAGTPIGDPLRAHEKDALALAIGEFDGRPIVLSGGVDRTVRLWDLAAGAPGLPEPLPAHELAIASVAVSELGNRPIVVTGRWDGTLRLWDFASGTPLGDPLPAHDSAVRALAVGELDGRPVAVSAGRPSFGPNWALRVWDLTAGAPLGEPIRTQGLVVGDVAICNLEGRPVAISALSDETLRLWDLATRASVGEPLPANEGGVSVLATGEFSGQPVVVSGGWDGVLRVWDVSTQVPLGEPLVAHEGGVRSLAVDELEGRPVAVSAGNDWTVRLWDLAAGAQLGEPLPVPEGYVAVAVGQLAGRPVAAYGGLDAVLRLWDLRAGRHVGFAIEVGSVISGLVFLPSNIVLACDDGLMRIAFFGEDFEHGALHLASTAR